MGDGIVAKSCLTLSRPQGLQPTPWMVSCPWASPGKNTGVGCHFLLQGIFPTQGSNLGLPALHNQEARVCEPEQIALFFQSPDSSSVRKNNHAEPVTNETLRKHWLPAPPPAAGKSISLVLSPAPLPRRGKFSGTC